MLRHHYSASNVSLTTVVSPLSVTNLQLPSCLAISVLLVVSQNFFTGHCLFLCLLMSIPMFIYVSHISEIIQYFSSLIHNDNFSSNSNCSGMQDFIFATVVYMCVCVVYHTFFVLLSVAGDLGCFRSWLL